MSAVNGPRGYEFQYLASVFIALDAMEERGEPIELFIERPGGEDLDLVYPKRGVTVEIQVKSDKKVINLNYLADVLCHFPADSDKNCALEHLLKDTKRFFWLFAGGRCNDDTAMFLTDQRILTHREVVKGNANFLKKLTNEISIYHSNAKKGIYKRRNIHCQNLAATLNQAADFSPFERVFITENITKQEIFYRCVKLLNIKFNISQGLASVVLRKLYDLILVGRDQQCEVSHKILKVIQENQVLRPQTSADYHTRFEETEIIDELEIKDIVLLRGQGLCGKTDIATSVSNFFYKKGYNYGRFLSILEAKEFLTTTITEDRICLLEDPFGQQIDPKELYRQIRSFDDLLTQRQPGRKLIVTCNQQVWAEIKELHKLHWKDMTVNTKEMSVKIWDRFGQKMEIEDVAFKAVRSYIENCPKESQLQPGHLAYLAKNYEGLKVWTEESIRHFAMIDAMSIAHSLKERKNTRITYITLALAADFVFGIAREGLLYLFGSDDDFPGIKQSSGLTGRIFGSFEKDEESHFPAYNTTEYLNPEVQDALDELEERGFIRYVDGACQFTHPIYYEAGRHLMKGMPSGMRSEVFSRLKRGLALLSVKNARNASSIIKYLLREYSDQIEVRSDLIGIAEFGLKSIFPSVKDICFLSLLDQYHLLNDVQLQKVQHGLFHDYQDTSSMFWYKGQPFHPKATTVGRRDPSKIYRYIDEVEFIRLCGEASKLLSVSTEQSWELLRYISYRSRSFPIDVSSQILSRLLLNQESFIRKMVAFHIMYQSPEPDHVLVDAIFGDEHPAVVFYAIKGAIRGCFRYDKSFRGNIINRCKRAFEQQEVLFCAIDFMSQFGIGYYHGSFDWRDHIPAEHVEGMWKFWGELMPSFFAKLPPIPRISTARFITTMNDSQRFLSHRAKLSVVKAWINWLSHVEHIAHRDDTYFYVTDYYLNFYGHLKHERSEIQCLLFKHVNSYFVGYNIRKFANQWLFLSDTEKLFLAKTANENDLYKAIVLTSPDLHVDLLALININRDFFDRPEETHNLLPSTLLQTCLSLLFVPYTYFSGHYRVGYFWKTLLKHYLTKPDSPICLLAIYQMFKDLSDLERNNFQLEYPRLQDNLRTISNDRKVMSFFICNLVRHLAYESSDYSQEFVSVLKESCNDESQSFLLAELVSNIEMIEQEGAFTFVENIFGEDLRKNLEDDWTLISFFDRAAKLKEYNAALAIGMFDHLAKEKKIRLDITCKVLEEYLNGCEGDQSEALLKISDYAGSLTITSQDQDKALDTVIEEIWDGLRCEFNSRVGE